MPEHFIQTIKAIISANENEKPQDAPVLDQIAGISNIGGDAQAYRLVLNEYLNENLDTADRLASAISEKRYPDAAQIVHKLKSSSGSIGAKSLYANAVALQRALGEANEHEIRSIYDMFSHVFTKLLDEIKQLLSR